MGAIGRDGEMLDVSQAEVREHVRATMARLRGDGYRWLKADFTYLAAVGVPKAAPDVTNLEALRAGYRAMREGAGDAFLMGIGLIAPNIGLVDAMRLTLDNGPRWDEPTSGATIESPRAMKGTVRTASRRWFYQNRVFVGHADLIFFRSWPDGGAPPLSADETRAFATWVSLLGSPVESGDTPAYLEAHPEAIDTLRRLMPVYPRGARPVDVMVRDYPERFEQEVDAEAGRWRNVGLFNWGKNRDLSKTPPVAMADEPRSYELSCEAPCLVHELWSQGFVGRKQGTFTVTVNPHSCQVLAVREATGKPQLLGSNRHVTQGAVELGAVVYEDSARELRAVVHAVPGTAAVPFEHEFSFYAPEGYALQGAEVAGAEGVAAMQEGEVVRVRFRVSEAGDREVRLRF